MNEAIAKNKLTFKPFKNLKEMMGLKKVKQLTAKEGIITKLVPYGEEHNIISND